MKGLINGRQIADEILVKLKAQVESLKVTTGISPGLAVVLVGNDASSLSFVKVKEKTAQKVGFRFEKKLFPATFSPPKVVEYIRQKNADPDTHGVVVQLPLPQQFDLTQILKTLHPFKDADCLHPKNLGLLFQGQPVFEPPVVKAVQKILTKQEIKSKDLRRMKTVVVGGGILVAKPLVLWLMQSGASVFAAGPDTLNLRNFTRQADLLVSGVGIPHYIKTSLVKKGALVIDFGFSQIEGKVIGDVDFEEISKKALVTPTPSGTGPITVACLLENVLKAASYEPNPQGLATRPGLAK